MNLTTDRYRNLASLAVLLASLTTLAGCSATKSLLGKRKAPAGEKTTELAASDEKKPAASDIGPAAYQQDGSRPEFALTSADLDGTAAVVQADAQLDLAPTDPISPHPFAGIVQHVGTDEFEYEVLNSDVPVLVDFYADWCGPCKKLSPTLDRIASETPNARVVKVNIDDSPRIAKKYGVSTIPTVMVFKNGTAVARNTGLASKGKLMGMLAE